jgi:hypothetical protein
MDRSGSFNERIPTRSWPPGDYPVTATLCDGWSSVRQTLGTFTK